MNARYDLKGISANIVYVKPVDAADLPENVLEQVGDLEQLFAVHDSNGEQLALVAHRDIAAHLAEQNNLEAVSLH